MLFHIVKHMQRLEYTRGDAVRVLSFINTYIFGPVLPISVFAAGFFMSVKLKFFHITRPKTVLRGIMRSGGDGTSPFKAMSVALAGTLGVGNIAGVAAAIASGGAGAAFWMWTSALFAMILKYAETVLAVKHRRVISENGKKRNTGGAFVYMAASGHRRLAFLFALLCIVTSVSMGSIVQSNAIAVSLKNSFSVSAPICGGILTVLTFIVITGGFSMISDLTVYAVPMFCLLYTAISLYIIFTNICELPAVISRILSEAFSLRCVGSGVMGYGIVRAMRFGVARGILSNEAGSGTSVTAHASSDAKSPCEQGFFGILEVFVDTIVLCSMSAFVILLSGDVSPEDAAMVTAIKAYSRFIGGFAPGFMSVAVVFFAFGTIICWSVYGVEALRFLISDYSLKLSFAKCKKLYYLIYSLSVLGGCVISGEFMWELSDISTALMTIINTAYLISAANEVRHESIGVIGEKNIRAERQKRINIPFV